MKTHIIATILTTLFLSFSQSAIAQIPQFDWAANLEWVNAIDINSVTTDSDSNVIVVGTFTNWQDLDPGSAQLLVDGQGDIFVMKLDKNGVMVWVKVIGDDTGTLQSAHKVVSDSSNNIYVLGNWPITGAPFDADPGPGVFTLTPQTNQAGYLISLDPNGDFRWAQIVPTNEVGETALDNDLVYDDNGALLLTASFSGAYDFDQGAGTFNMSSVGISSFVLKLDLDGNFIWAKGLLDNIRARAIDCSSNGDIFLTGVFQGSPDFDPNAGTATISSNGPLTDGFVLKLTSNGDFMWVKGFGGTDFERMHDIACDNNGEVYVTGDYEGTTDLDPGAGVFSATASGARDNFVLHLDNLGDFVWANPITVDQELDFFELDVDTSNNLYIGGYVEDTIDIDPSINVFEISASPSTILNDNVDVFFAKVDPSGNLVWVRVIGGEVVDQFHDIHVAKNFDVHIVGLYDETVDFDPGPGTATYTSVGSYDGFNAKFSQCFQSAPTPDLSTLSDVTADCQVNNIIPPTASEFCTGSITGIPDVTFPITTQGTTTVTWTYDAGNGFVTTQTQNVIISDNSPPTPNQTNLPDINAQCEIDTIIPPTATDNCLGNVTITSDAVFPITTNTTVTWTYEDENGNAATQTQSVIVMDTNPPVPNITSLSDIDSECPVTSLTAPTATDNCSATISVTNDAVLPIESSTLVTWTYDDGNGNTSTQTQNVNITPIDVSTTLDLLMDNTQEISANASGYTYQWIEDCDGTNTLISGATNQAFYPSTNGSYAVIISNGICSDTSDCVIIDDLNLDEYTHSLIRVFPNPTNGTFTVQSDNLDEATHIKIYNTLGQRIEFKTETSSGSVVVEFAAKPGLYFLKIENQRPIQIIKL